jgi:hypothetical protein
VYRPRMRLLPPALLFVTLACSQLGCGGGAQSGLPYALRDRTDAWTFQPYSGFTVPGLTLYLAVGFDPHGGPSYVVGVDTEDHVVESEALMRRLGPLSPDVFASRAIAILLGETGMDPVLPTDDYLPPVTEHEWTVVRAPRREGNAVVFYFMRADAVPVKLREVAIDVDSFAVSYRTAAEVLAAGQVE